MQVRATAPFTATLVGRTPGLVGRPASVPLRVGAHRLATLSARAGRWLLPWACVLTVSGAIAHATEQGLATTLLAEPAPLAKLASDGVRRDRAPAPAGSHWVTIASIDADGMSSNISCLTRVELMSADVIAVPLGGLDVFVSRLCSDVSP